MYLKVKCNYNLMKVEYLLSFKNKEELQNLDKEFLNKVSVILIKTYTKKVKKKIIKPVSKSNLLKNAKLQSSKDKTENKVNLIVNKLSKTNFEEVIKEFIETFLTIDQVEFNKILKVLFLKIIKDDKFTELFFEFYLLITNIYQNLFDVSNEYFINLIETKVKFDYLDEQLEKEYSFISKLNREECRNNNLNLILLLIKSNNLNMKILTVISNYVVNTNYVPDIYFWFSKKTVKNEDPISNYNTILTNKLSEDINNRFVVLLKNLLDNNDIKYEEEEFSSDSESICDINYESNKSNFEIEIENILEEYLLLEDFDEILNFLDKYKTDTDNIKVFTSNLLNIYFNSAMSNIDKFKKLFINLKKKRLIKSDLFKDSLSSLVNDEGKDDYLNFDNKMSKIIDIYKIIQIKMSKKYLESIKI